MSMRKVAVRTGVAALALGASVALGALAFAESPKLGKPITQADLAEWDINVLPDGTNLPAGSGKAADGAKIYAQKCAACHGENGEGGHAVRLIGGPLKATLDGGKTIANYWPYATTVFDFIRRAAAGPRLAIGGRARLAGGRDGAQEDAHPLVGHDPGRVRDLGAARGRFHHRTAGDRPADRHRS